MMSDKIRIDSHKLMFHPERVSQWKNGELVYPIEIEIGLSGACNHRCVFCAVDYMEYTPIFLDVQILKKNLIEMGRKGVKSIIYAGEGEPLLNKNAGIIFNKTKEFGMDVALSTNGVLFTKELSEYCLGALSWIRFSIAAATSSTYEKIHQSKPNDLQKVLANLEEAVKIKKERGLLTTLGVQLLLLPENKDEVVLLAKMMKEIGVDYFTVKPFSQHPQSKVKLQLDYSESEQIGRELEQYQTEKFKIYFRSKSIENLMKEKNYNCCRGLHFMTYMNAMGDIFPCIVFMGKKEFIYGNINKQSFVSIWESERAQKIKNMFNAGFIKENCRKTCRLDEINKYLHELDNPSQHVNFI